MQRLKVDQLYGEVADPIVAIFEEELVASESDELLSPDLLDNLVWGVLINFLVCVAANLATPLVRLKGKHQLSDKDVDSIKTELHGKEVEVGAAKESDIEAAVGVIVPATLSPVKKTKIIRRISRVLLDALKSKHDGEDGR